MRYLLLIYQTEASMSDSTEEDQQAVLAEYLAFNEATQAAGQYIAGDALQPVDTATTVRVRDGKALVTDGPFAETKEQLGGYYLVEAKDLDEALEIAARIPAARDGSIEVRLNSVPVFVGWVYDSALNAIVFDVAHVPEDGVSLEIEYSVLASGC